MIKQIGFGGCNIPAFPFTKPGFNRHTRSFADIQADRPATQSVSSFISDPAAPVQYTQCFHALCPGGAVRRQVFKKRTQEKRKKPVAGLVAIDQRVVQVKKTALRAAKIEPTVSAILFYPS